MDSKGDARPARDMAVPCLPPPAIALFFGHGIRAYCVLSCGTISTKALRSRVLWSCGWHPGNNHTQGLRSSKDLQNGFEDPQDGFKGLQNDSFTRARTRIARDSTVNVLFAHIGRQRS